MQFHKLVAIVAILTLAVNANANDGTLRRGYTVAQNDTTIVNDPQPTQGVVILNSNTNTNSNSSASAARNSQTQTAQQQPTTYVEANPVGDSRAEQMRRARQSAEVNTEQKIVEKLEESRLREENERAERIFGNRLDTPAASATATAIVTPNGAAATATAVTTVEPVKEERATQVTIEKVEIIHPAPAPVVREEEPVAESKIQLVEAKEQRMDRFYVSGILAAPSYSASNIQSNYGLGVALGTIRGQVGLEGSFLFSNHAVDTYWQTFSPYANLDQYDFSLAAKYSIFPGPFRPYVGASLSYIYRLYTERMQNSSWLTNDSTQEEETHAVNVGLLAGADFAISESFMIGAGVDWNYNVMKKSDFSYTAYNLPANSKPLEEIDYYTLKLNAKVSF